jgi:hypothetical protein
MRRPPGAAIALHWGRALGLACPSGSSRGEISAIQTASGRWAGAAGRPAGGRKLRRHVCRVWGGHMQGLHFLRPSVLWPADGLGRRVAPAGRRTALQNGPGRHLSPWRPGGIRMAEQKLRAIRSAGLWLHSRHT